MRSSGLRSSKFLVVAYEAKFVMVVLTAKMEKMGPLESKVLTLGACRNPLAHVWGGY